MKYVIIISFFSLLFGLNKTQSNAIQLLTPKEFKERVEGKKVQLVDVRTPAEFKSGHIDGAKNIDFFSVEFNMEFNKLNKEKPVYLYCRSGNRSQKTSKKLEALGFIEIYDLKGGILKY